MAQTSGPKGKSNKATATSRAKKAPKKKAAAKKKKKTDNVESDSEEDDGPGAVKLDWEVDNYALTWSMLTAITDKQEIQDALYPPTGANASTKNGGGKRKTDHHWEICKTLFTDHSIYGEAFKIALNGKSADRKRWTRKIKNRLTRMSALVVKANGIMGATGEGLKINSADEITDPELRNKWDVVVLDCPFYFTLRKLLGQRPNHKPAGLGNSTSPIDGAVLLTVNGGEAKGGEGGAREDSKKEDGDGDSSEDSEDEDSEDDEADAEDEDEVVEVGKKRKASTATTAESKKAPAESKKTPARPSTSAAATPVPKAKKLKGMLNFEELAKAEETTRQKELELRTEKVRYNSEKVKADAKLKLQRDKQAYELRVLEFQARKELAIEQMRLNAANGPMHGASPALFNPLPMSFASTPSTSRSASAVPPFSFDELNGFDGFDGSGLESSPSA
ncbi:hypothetical protein OH76DRAFT_1487018 [Lentinus brumalis]|uniref:No apical meristem-associated C-terminal domain-containing protein n=1 Tax=Lentinus brumalis TaxID=2498619 RepID=A0A371CWE9_9APHY|nr:hypothetical protein OH76DRAFT_1487018 [Polyporus brumalis]